MNENDWADLVRDLRSVNNVDVAVAATERLHRDATAEDLPRLRELLKDESFFVREAAAWPLSELAGAMALSELFEAYQRVLDEGHDNDGFSAALIELAAADPKGVQAALQTLATSTDAALRQNALWLMEFCDTERDG
jgi:HEAT repeat protein